MKKSEQALVKRTYRITKKNDKFVKKSAKKAKGESAFVRSLISAKDKKK